MKDREYITTIGLEVHLQLSTETKAFCGCRNEFGREPNSSACPVCLGFPGSLPVLNEEFLRYAIKVALALNCRISEVMKFDRKNYFYPDLPKNYQISQYDSPLSTEGYVEIETSGGTKKVSITRVHLEEDAGKLIHDEKRNLSFIDFNRSGTPLLEIVSEPDIASPEEAYIYLTTLKAILEYLQVSDCDMEKGSLRCDANISVRPSGQQEFGEKVELKNMNSFKWVKMALEYEQNRQIRLLSKGQKVIQETRLWNAEGKLTEPMRTKEEAHDYRYFPEPDLPPFLIDKVSIKEISRTLPELPHAKCKRFIKEYGLLEYDASVLVSDITMSNCFEACAKQYQDPKQIANWLIGDVLKYCHANNIEFRDTRLTAQILFEMLTAIDEGTASGKMAKDYLLPEMLRSGKSPKLILKEKNLSQITDREAIEKFIDEVIAQNREVVNDYLAGKEKALIFLVGALMKKTKGKVNPQLANEILKKKLEKEKR